MLLGAGLLHGSRIFSYEMLLMDAEIWSILRAMFRGIDINEETLALDAIREVGPGGMFLTHSHTLEHMGQLWLPTLMDRRPYSVWEEKRDGAREWALARAREILSQEPLEILDPKLKFEFQKIIETVEQG